MPDARRLRRPGRAGTSPPSPAALGVVKVSADFTDEYPDGDPLTAETMATLVRAGQAITAELARTMLASYGVPQPVMTCLAVIDGADDPADAERDRRADAALIGDGDEHARRARAPRLGRAASPTRTIAAASWSRSPMRARPSPTASCLGSGCWSGRCSLSSRAPSAPRC